MTSPGGDVAFDVGLGVATPPDEPPQTRAPGFPDALLDLADRYRTLRWTMPRGAARTRAMTGLVDEMRAAVRAAGDVDVRPLLGDDDIGLRLVAAAALHERPDARAVRPLAEQALSDRKPFNEYWSLLALRRCLHGRCDLLTDDLRDRLERRSAEVRQDADRANAIARILRDCP